MARDWNSYYRLLRALIPRGRAWTPDNGTLNELLQGKAVELARVDSRMEELLLEGNTLTTTELIADHLEVTRILEIIFERLVPKTKYLFRRNMISRQRQRLCSVLPVAIPVIG